MKQMILAVLTVLSSNGPALAAAGRDQINIVGSSTVYPFSTVVAERFGKTTEFKAPKIEATGTGGGMKLFCQGVGVEHPDIANASRRIKRSEIENCRRNGVTGILEVLIGYDGIVLASSKEAKPMSFRLRDIYLALAKEVPDPDGSRSFLPNPNTIWNQVNPALPATRIEVLGPPPTSGTRDAFNELAVEGGCRTYDWIVAMEKTEPAAYKRVCHTIREDGVYIEATENDNLIVQKLVSNPGALGVFGFSFLDQNLDKVQGSLIGGNPPTFENIANGSYPVARPLYFYVKKAHIGKIPGILEFIQEFTSKRAMSEEGYLAEKGLIPLAGHEYERVVANVRELKCLRLDAR